MNFRKSARHITNFRWQIQNLQVCPYGFIPATVFVYIYIALNYCARNASCTAIIRASC